MSGLPIDARDKKLDLHVDTNLAFNVNHNLTTTPDERTAWVFENSTSESLPDEDPSLTAPLCVSLSIPIGCEDQTAAISPALVTSPSTMTNENRKRGGTRGPKLDTVKSAVLDDRSREESDSLRSQSNSSVDAKIAKKFVCSGCGKTFTRENSLLAHASIHTGERPFGCDLCGKTFRLKYNLDLHASTVHSDGESRGANVMCKVYS